MKVYEAIGRGLAHEGTEAVFGLMGDGNLQLIPFITDELGLPFYGARHESGAVAMADGYARVTGAVGVCTFTQGPGMTNALTALVSARRGRTPLVVLSGDTPTTVRGLPQDIDQHPFFAAADLPVQPLEPGTVGASVAAAFRRARQDRTPVVLNLPTDLQEQECEWHAPEPEAVAAPWWKTATVDVADAVAALSGAERPVVIAGRGALISDARDELIALADHVGALLATSLPLKGWFAAHPWDVGIAGGFASPLGHRLLGEADCVISFGASLNHFTSRGGTLFDPSATIVQVDVDRGAFGRYYPTSLQVLGDAKGVAQRLRRRLAPAPGFRTEQLADEIAQARVMPVDSGSDGAAIDPRVLSAVIDTLVPGQRALVVDGGHFMGFPSMHMGVPDPSQFVFTLDFGSVGLGIGAAIGAAVARPDQVTVAAIGDGGLLMSLGELDTAVRYGLPILFVVYNDEAYGAEMHFLRMLGAPDAESLFEVPPLDRVAEALGADALPVTSLTDLEGLRERLESMDGPLLLDCRISRDVRAVWLEEAFERGTH
jgi:thiamine pyrophosphate-dependent acetolactate synthase large subunit-like protein